MGQPLPLPTDGVSHTCNIMKNVQVPDQSERRGTEQSWHPSFISLVSTTVASRSETKQFIGWTYPELRYVQVIPPKQISPPANLWALGGPSHRPACFVPRLKSPEMAPAKNMGGESADTVGADIHKWSANPYHKRAFNFSVVTRTIH